MKILVRTDQDNLCVWSFEDTESVTVESDRTFVGDSEVPSLVFDYLSTANVILYENIDLPEDWFACKYNYDGTTWTESDGWAAIKAAMDKAEAAGKV